MKKLKKSLAVLLSLMMLMSLMIVSPVGVSAVGTGSSLPGKFILVNDKGDIGAFDANGKLTYTATETDYVWVRNYDTGVQYCTDGWQGSVDTVTLVNEKTTSQFDKLCVPEGEQTLTLIDNGDDTFTLSYGTGSSLPGKFILVNDKGDIGAFDANGKLTYTATETDYVWVRNYDTGVQYCTDGWQGSVDTVTLVNEKTTSQFDKLCVPEGEQTLTLIYNGDDTFTLSYGEIEPITTEPTSTEITTTEPTTSNPTEPTEPAEDKLNFVVLGDSIAAGYGIESEVDRYANIVANNKEYDLNNLAVSGHKSADLLKLVKEDSKVKSGVEKADIISVSIGGNDFLHDLNAIITNLTLYGAESKYVKNIIENLNTNLNGIITEIRKLNPDTVIILQTVYNPLAIKNVYGITIIPAFAQVYAVFNSVFISVADANENVYVADVYTAFANDYAENNNPEIIQDDGIHPSVSGHKIISDVLLSEINELIAMGVINEKKDTTSYIVGDANGDGGIDVADATILQKFINYIPVTIHKEVADVNADGRIDVRDATAIQKKIAGYNAF